MSGVASPRIAQPIEMAGLCDRCLGTMDATGPLDLSRLKLRGARLLIDKVAAVGSAHEHIVSDTGIIAPAASDRVRSTYGIEGRVLAIGPGIDRDEIAVGDRVIIDEFAGRPLFWEGRLLPYWIVGEGEVMIAITDAAK